MPSKKNVENLKQLKSAFTEAKSSVFIDYSKLTANQINELRAKLKEVGGLMKVAKNTLIEKSLPKKAGLEGQTAVIFGKEDSISPIKILYEFIKENELPQVKLGIFEGEQVDESKLAEIAVIPSKNELLAKLAGGLKSPVYGFHNVLIGNRSKFVYVLKAVADGNS